MFFLKFAYFGDLISDVFKEKKETKKEQEVEINESLVISDNQLEDI